ncbi:MAG: DNA-binding transcriptional regulator YbjK [Candidatus Azotimanducaceae bacterium]|jgi:DNA-binding transcriptional regulator YbjK
MELKQIKPKPERKVKSRDKILNAALEVIALEGVDAITHRRVGKQSNLSNGVVSYHFPTREDLVNETFLFHLRQLEQLSEDITRLKPSEKVSDFIDATVEFVKRDQATPHLVRADYELILYAARQPTLAKIFRDWENVLAINIATELKNFGIKDSKRCARIVINLVRAYELECMTRPELELKEFRARLQRVVSGFQN